MQLKTFQAPDIRTALAAVKLELGPEALVVATRTIPGGLLSAPKVEVTAALEEARPASPEAPSAVSGPAPTVVPLTQAARIQGEKKYGGEARRRDTHTRTAGMSEDAQKAARRVTTSLCDADVEPDIAERLGLLVARRAPDLEEATLQASLSAHLTERLADVRDPSFGGHAVVAVVGPTGCGKTTSIAKLAAHAALVRRKRVALISVDTFRVGALEQLRAYADLMQVPLTVARDPASFGKALRAHADVDLVLVDTAGRGPHDAEQVPALAAMFEGQAVRTCLCLAATTRRYEIRRILERYKPLTPRAALLTKLDESTVGGAVLNVAMGGGLPLSWITFGQRVPEDIARADARQLADWVVKNGEDTSFTSWHGMALPDQETSAR